MERVLYECRIYGYDVYYAFSQYCFWRNVVRTQFADWLAWVPAYFLGQREEEGEGCPRATMIVPFVA